MRFSESLWRKLLVKLATADPIMVQGLDRLRALAVSTEFQGTGD
jgi:hypothetical protein